MSRNCEKALAYHQRGFNCCQSVLAGCTDLTGLSEQESFDLGGGFGSGAGTGEICGALSGAIMVLGKLTPVDANDPIGSKKRTVAKSKELQKRFSETFHAIRCHDLLKNKFVPDDTTPAAKAMGLTKHCDIMVVTAVEVVEQMLEEEKSAQ